jgi:hypothetical protein
MIEKEHLDGGIFVYKLNIGGPTLTHVMYVDDILLFSKATRYEASSLNDCLDKHCGWSRQMVWWWLAAAKSWKSSKNVEIAVGGAAYIPNLQGWLRCLLM